MHFVNRGIEIFESNKPNEYLSGVVFAKGIKKYQFIWGECHCLTLELAIKQVITFITKASLFNKRNVAYEVLSASE